MRQPKAVNQSEGLQVTRGREPRAAAGSGLGFLSGRGPGVHHEDSLGSGSSSAGWAGPCGGLSSRPLLHGLGTPGSQDTLGTS